MLRGYGMPYDRAIGWSEDLCQRAWQTAYEERDTFDPNKGEFFTWLYGIAKNHVRNWLRKNSNWREIPTDPEEFKLLPLKKRRWESPSQQTERTQLMQILDEQIENLPSRYRDVMRLTRQGDTHTEIAEKLKIQPATARKRFSKGVEMLRVRLQRLGLYDELVG